MGKSNGKLMDHLYLIVLWPVRRGEHFCFILCWCLVGNASLVLDFLHSGGDASCKLTSVKFGIPFLFSIFGVRAVKKIE